MPIIVKGEIAGVRSGEFDKKKYAVLQFSEDVEDGSVRFFEVNLPDDADFSAYKRGQTVELPVRISAKDKKIYYRAIGPNTAPPPRPAPDVMRSAPKV
jgi:hypothetical protein